MGCRRDDEGGLLQGAGKEGNARGKGVAGKQSWKKSGEGNSGKGIPWDSPKKVYAIQSTLPEVSERFICEGKFHLSKPDSLLRIQFSKDHSHQSLKTQQPI